MNVTRCAPSKLPAGANQESSACRTAAGSFHLYWIDNRDGLPQVWTTAITPALDARDALKKVLMTLSDVTDMVTIESAAAEYDQATGRATLSLALKNTSTQVIKPPLKLRLLMVDSDFGVPLLTERDGATVEGGKIIDLSEAIPADGVLGPGSAASRYRCHFLYRIDLGRRCDEVQLLRTMCSRAALVYMADWVNEFRRPDSSTKQGNAAIHIRGCHFHDRSRRRCTQADRLLNSLFEKPAYTQPAISPTKVFLPPRLKSILPEATYRKQR